MAKFINPILSGDYPDPSIVRDGQDYYMTYSCAYLAPGLKILHSRDLVHWRTVSVALKGESHCIAAPELVRHDGLYYLYYPEGDSNWVVTAKHPAGPWSDPVDLHVGRIDPGHIATPEGERFLYLSGGYAAPLSSDGLSLIAQPVKVYVGWPYGDRYLTEGFCLESPKMFYREGYYYLISAQGGTAGPATAHMVVAARARHPMGPWENAPNNPLVHTRDRHETWWCKGHGTIFEDHTGGWRIIYHAYEKDYLNRGRNVLLQPVSWTREGWPVVEGNAEDTFFMDWGEDAGVDNLCDDFSGLEWKKTWCFWKKRDPKRYVMTGQSLIIRGAQAGTVGESNLMTLSSRDHAYAVSVHVACHGKVSGGLILQYNEAHYCGIALEEGYIRFHKYGRPYLRVEWPNDQAWLKIVNDHHQIAYYVSANGEAWQFLNYGCEVSGLNHNALDGYDSLRPGLFALGAGEAEFRGFTYTKL